MGWPVVWTKEQVSLYSKAHRDFPCHQIRHVPIVSHSGHDAYPGVERAFTCPFTSNSPGLSLSINSEYRQLYTSEEGTPMIDIVYYCQFGRLLCFYSQDVSYFPPFRRHLPLPLLASEFCTVVNMNRGNTIHDHAHRCPSC